MQVTNASQRIPKPKKKFNIEEKRALCREWEASGLSRDAFGQLRNVSQSALYQWSRKLFSKKNAQPEDWIPIKITGNQTVGLGEPIMIELSLPNQCVARIQLSRSDVVNFFQEICNATTAIR